MTIPRGELDAVIRDGLVADIFRLERATAILNAMGKRATEINSGRGHFGILFGALQAALTTEAILAVSRIFDAPSKRYPTRCIRGVLDYLALHAADFTQIREPYQLDLALKQMQAPTQIVFCATNTPSQFATEFASYVDVLLNEPNRRENLIKLRDLRDKRLAHNEHAVSVDAPTWAAITDFAEVAKSIVGVLSWAYFSTAYVVNGEYILTQDAHKAARALDRLLEQIYPGGVG